MHQLVYRSFTHFAHPGHSTWSAWLSETIKRNKEDSVRVRTLNIIIYKAVVDLLSSYEVNSDLSAYNVQISKVSLSPDFSACQIYWKTNLSAEQDSHIQQALNKCNCIIWLIVFFRHLLISNQILGNVPPVVFIRDKQYGAVTEIENLLKKADFDKKRPVLFGVDHDALHKQIEAYKRESPAAGGLTQEQLDMLSKWMKDDDITPKDFLLSRSLQKEDKEEQDGDEDSLVDSQVTELMEEDNRRH
uniref:Ribosome binding factor A n=1 Tax=Sinocyclocheilus anshuiensis TaxID=1608454 RepID=A0A671LYN1_9TELE